jgi:hypothetical protein
MASVGTAHALTADSSWLLTCDRKSCPFSGCICAELWLSRPLCPSLVINTWHQWFIDQICKLSTHVGVSGLLMLIRGLYEVLLYQKLSLSFMPFFLRKIILFYKFQSESIRWDFLKFCLLDDPFLNWEKRLMITSPCERSKYTAESKILTCFYRGL